MTIQLMYLIWKCAVMFSQRSWEKSGSTLQGGLCGSIRVFIRDVQSLKTTEPLLSGWSTQQRDTYSSSQCAEITSTSATAVCLHLLQWECFYWHTNSPRMRDIQFILLKDIRADHFTCSSVLMRCRAKRQLWHCAYHSLTCRHWESSIFSKHWDACDKLEDIRTVPNW